MAAPAAEGLPPVASASPRPQAPKAGLSAGSLRRGGLVFGASQVVGMGLGFVITLLLTRVAPAAEVGFYFQIVQATLAVGLLLQLGLGPATLRFAPLSRGEGGEAATARLRRRLLGMQVAIWAVAVPPLAFAWPYIARLGGRPELAGAAGIVLGISVLASLGHLLDAYLRSFRMYALAAPLTQVVPRALILGTLLYLWLATPGDASWELLVSIYTAALLVALLGYIPALRATTAGETSEPRAAQMPPDVRTILGTTTAMGLRGAVSVLLVASDLWILSWARPDDLEAPAAYGVATRLIHVMAALPGIANFLIPQEFTTLYADGRKADMERLARTASTAVAIVSFAALLGLVALGRPLLGFLGEEYIQGWGIALILAVGTFWDTASGSAGYALQMTGHHVRLLKLTAGAALFNLALAALLGRLWGGYGIATATTITLILLNLVMVQSARKLVGVSTFVYLQPAQWKRVFQLLVRREKPV